MLGETYKTLGASNTLMKTSHEYEGQFWKYKEEIKSIVFEEKIDIPTDAIESWDVSESKNGTVMAYIKGNDSNELYYDLYIQGNDKIYANKDSSCLFTGFINVDYINNIELLDTSNVTNMSSMFSFMENLKSLNLSKFDTSKVTDMNNMFSGTGQSSTVFKLDCSNWNVSNVTKYKYFNEDVSDKVIAPKWVN